MCQVPRSCLEDDDILSLLTMRNATHQLRVYQESFEARSVLVKHARIRTLSKENTRTLWPPLARYLVQLFPNINLGYTSFAMFTRLYSVPFNTWRCFRARCGDKRDPVSFRQWAAYFWQKVSSKVLANNARILYGTRLETFRALFSSPAVRRQYAWRWHPTRGGCSQELDMIIQVWMRACNLRSLAGNERGSGEESMRPQLSSVDSFR